MSGIVNSTGARSGIIGTITSAPVAYEEGTFTPLVLAATSNPTCSYGTRVGQYVKVGNIYLVMARVILTAKSGGVGNIQVNLPSTPLDVAADWNGSTRCHGYVSLKNPNYVLARRNNPNVKFGQFFPDDATDAQYVNVDISDVTASADTQFTVIYHAQ